MKNTLTVIGLLLAWLSATGGEVSEWIVGWSNAAGMHQTNRPIITNLYGVVGSRLTFGLTEDFVKTGTTTVYGERAVLGHFWTEWERIDGCAERTREVLRPRTFEVTNSLSAVWLTNFLTIQYPSSFQCNKEHWDGSEHVETTYSQSNLLARLVWRGVTNEWCLESICCATNTRKWHWEKVKRYE